MGFFSPNYNRPGPGIPKDAPKKKGIMRFFEIVGRDMGSLVKVNFIYVLCSIPTIILSTLFITVTLVEGFYLGFILIFVPLIALTGILTGPATAAAQAVIIDMVRDEPGYVWHTFRHKFKQNFKPAAILGVVFSLVFTLEAVAGLFYVLTVIGNSATANIALIALYIFNLILVFSVGMYSFLQVIFLDLKNFAIIKNSLLLTFGMAKRSLPGTLISLVIIVASILFMPYTIILYFIFIPVLIMLIADMWIWPTMEKTFKISDQLNARREEKYFGEVLTDKNTPPTE